MDAPERIWVGEDLIEHDAEGAHVTADPEATHVEYVRADALAAKDAEIERLGSELRAAQERYAVCCDKRSRLREALSNAAHALDVVRSAISTSQIVDKDALGTAKRGRDAARAALENSHE